MIHTWTITHRILSPKTFDEIYKELEVITGEKPRCILYLTCVPNFH